MKDGRSMLRRYKGIKKPPLVESGGVKILSD